MNVCLYLDRSRVFRWHFWIADTLRANPGYQLSIAFAPDTHPLPKHCFVLFALEKLVYRIRGQSALDRVDDRIRSIPDGGSFDILIDFSLSAAPLPQSDRVLTPYFNGLPGEIGAIAMLFGDRGLSVEISDNQYCVVSGFPASTDRQVFARSLDNLLSCTAAMVVKSVTAPSAPSVPYSRGDTYSRGEANPPLWALVSKASMTVMRKTLMQIERLVTGRGQWAVGWRINSASLLESQVAMFGVIADNRDYYLADPFPLRYHGGDLIFMEQFDYALGQGHIAVTKIINDQTTRLVAVIETPYHISYPFIFEDGGEIWMIPETGAAHGIDLYRAEKFPCHWKLETRLLDGIDGNDATITRIGDQLWMFVSERFWNSSSWDALSLFYANRLSGPWRAHRDNPILFDATRSRPGGALFQHNGELIRPMQDCSRFYGGTVLLCRVDGLEPFAQTMRGVVSVAGAGCHTFNNHRGLEVIDVFGHRRRTAMVAAHYSEATKMVR
jgi:hypothetical protein